MKQVNAAIIRIDPKLLLDWLQFKGGRIHSISIPPERLFSDTIDIVIEHPDLPLTEESSLLRVIAPSYQREIDSKGNLVSIERVDPPKRDK